MASGALDGRHKRFVIQPLAFAHSLFQTPFQHWDDPFERRIVVVDLSHKVLVGEREDLIGDPFQQFLLEFLGQILPAVLEGEPPALQHCRQLAEEIGLHIGTDCRNGSLVKGLCLVRDDQIRIEFHMLSQAHAVRTGSIGCVEGKQPGFDFRQADTAFRTGELLAVHMGLSADLFDGYGAFPQLQGGLQ